MSLVIFVDLGSEAFMLHEATEGFGVTDQSVLGHRRDEHATEGIT